MPITAVCPYCRVGRVRAPERAVGLSYPCPHCHSQFTLSPASEAELAAARASGHTPSPPPRPAPAEDTVAHAATLEVQRGSEAEEPPPDSITPPLPFSSSPARSLPPAPVTDPGLPWALVALTFAGVGLAASQLPYGRLLTAGLAGTGLLVAGLGVLAAERKKLLPAAACGANLFAGLLAVAFPGLLGLAGWLPLRVEDNSNQVLAIGHGGGDRAPAEWVDASTASWQQDDVRVAVRFATVRPVDLVGPGGQKKLTKENVLQIGLRVANAGVARSFQFQGWSTDGPTGTVPRLTDPDGRVLAAKRFDPGWAPAAAGMESRPLFPGKAAECLLVFEPPAPGVESVRLELPGAAFGGEQSVRLQIPVGFSGMR